MKFLIKFVLGLALINWGFYTLAKRSNILENELLSNLIAQDFKKSTILKFENLNLDFDSVKTLITEKINARVLGILDKKYDGNISYLDRLIESEKLFQKKKYKIAELSYSKAFSSLYTLQKIQTLSRIEVSKTKLYSFFHTSLKSHKFLTGKQLYKQIKLHILMKRVDCLIRLKRLHKVFFLLNLCYKLDEFSIVEKYFQKRQLELLFPRPYFSIVENLSKKFGVQDDLIFAIMREETHFNEKAKSHAGALGLMQLMPKTAKELHQEINRKYPGLFKIDFNNDDLWNYELNIIYGIYYLSKLQKRYKGQYQFMVAAYNAGPGPVKRWRKCTSKYKTDFESCVTYKETSSYLARVLGSLKYYEHTYKDS